MTRNDHNAPTAFAPRSNALATHPHHEEQVTLTRSGLHQNRSWHQVPLLLVASPFSLHLGELQRTIKDARRHLRRQGTLKRF